MAEQELKASAQSACLDEDQVLAYATGAAAGSTSELLLRHLDTCPRCQALLAAAARAALSTNAGAREARALAVGEVCVGRYEIVRFIGAGGMGEVYEARDRELGETVALKTVALTTLDDHKAVARLKSEVQLARKTTHPNVCRIFDFAVHVRPRPGAPEVLPFLTMELLSGETLAAYLKRRGSLTFAEARPLLEQILAGLGAVHRQSIVHRDFKPENVLLVGGERVRAVVMDFGLARPMFPEGGAHVSLQHTLVGTASYMAPEQVEAKEVTFASDVYAVGVVMFEMATGRLPFVGGNAMEVALQRVKAPAPRPSSVAGDVDQAWEDVILNSLERRPERRYQTMAELGRALERARRASWWRRRRVLGAVAAVAALGLGWTYRHRLRGRVDESVTGDLDKRVAAWREREGELTTAMARDPEHAADYLVDRSIVNEERAELAMQRGQNAFAGLAAAEDDLTRVLELNPQSAVAHHRRGKVRCKRAQGKLKYRLDPSGDLEGAEVDLRHDIKLNEARSWLGQVQIVRGEWRRSQGQDARPDFEAAEATLAELTDFLSRMRRGQARAYLGKFAAAEEDFAWSTQRHPDNPWAWTKWGQARALAGDLAGAEEKLTKAITTTPEFSEAWEERGNVRYERKDFARAATDYQRAIAINPALEPLAGVKLREAQDELVE